MMVFGSEERWVGGTLRITVFDLFAIVNFGTRTGRRRRRAVDRTRPRIVDTANIMGNISLRDGGVAVRRSPVTTIG